MNEPRRRPEDGAPRRRRYAPRSKSGCLACRSRRKRCSGETPECDACVRLNIECIYEPKKRLLVERGHFDTGGSRRRISGSSSTVSPSLYEVVNGDRCSPPIDPSLQRQPPSPISLLPDACRFNHVDPKILISYYIHSFVPKISCVNVPSNAFTSVYVPMAFQCKAVLDAIIACASSHLAKTSADEGRRLALLEVSAMCQMRCHHYLQERISSSGDVQRNALEAMTIILLLVGLEVQNGARTHRWVEQLDCVRKIVCQYGGRAAFCRSSWEAGCLYQHFLYHDVMGLVMSGVSGRNILHDGDELPSSAHSPAIPLDLTSVSMPWDKYIRDTGAHASPAETTPPSHTDLPNSLHPLLGLSTNLFFLIQKIHHIKDPATAGSSGYELLDEELFLNLEHDIVSLRFDLYPPPSSSSTEMSISHLDISTRLDLVILAETYRLAALVLLYRRSNRNTSQLEAIAQRIISLTRRISSGSAAEAGLTCPLFLAGAELTAEDDILMCATKLMSIRDRVKVMNIQSVEAVLEEVWRGRLNGEPSRDWEHVLRDWEWVINLG